MYRYLLVLHRYCRANKKKSNNTDVDTHLHVYNMSETSWGNTSQIVEISDLDEEEDPEQMEYNSEYYIVPDTV